jgi:hypothetical protein
MPAQGYGGFDWDERAYYAASNPHFRRDMRMISWRRM